MHELAVSIEIHKPNAGIRNGTVNELSELDELHSRLSRFLGDRMIDEVSSQD
ncbi:MAG: hypothetical protein R2848_15700 [Thermomicrobiales bacterium]